MSLKNGTILIVDDDKDVLYTAKLILKRHFNNVLCESTPNRILSLLENTSIDAVLLDMNYKTGATSGNEGLFWLSEIRKRNPQASVIMNTAYGEIGLAVECMKKGADDFIVKPWEKDQLVHCVAKVMKLRKTEQDVSRLKQTQNIVNNDRSRQLSNFIAKSSKMQRILDLVSKVAPTDADVLILGENGTGKELIAKSIHQQSLRQKEPFVSVDMGSITDTLFESELFGHQKGSFTDAKEDRIGRFEMATNGTMFLDEIGNLPLPLQAKLLTVLQSRVVTRVGSSQAIPINVRLVSATNRPIQEMVKNEEFRQDLMYRLNTLEIKLPALRERKEDIPDLIHHFLQRFSEKYLKSGLKIPDSTMNVLTEYHWPGNVRELEHAVERAVILSTKVELSVDDFALPKSSSSLAGNDLIKVEDFEKVAILNALEKCDNNLSQAAIEMGMGRSTLYRKMKKYNLQ